MISRIIVLSICFSISMSAQDLESGFAMLESSNYTEAAQLFSDILMEEPSHKTAKICYARALGLGGSPAEAYDLFLELASEYPQDTEVSLNLAEALLWTSDYNSAIEIYSQILKSEPLNFVANYGYANAHAGIFKNDIALQYVDKAIAIQPDNSSAHNARRHILLSKAYLLYKSSDLTDAQSVLGLLSPDDSKANEIRNMISAKLSSAVNAGYQYRWDNGGYITYVKNFGVSAKLGDKNKLGFQLSDYKVESSQNLQFGQQQSMLLNNQTDLSSVFKMTTGLGLYATKFGSEQNNLNLAKSIALEGFWSQRLYTSLSYKNELHNYSPELLRSDIDINQYALAFNLNLFAQLGLYNKTILTKQSDSNRGNIIFTSLYYTLSKAPIVKVGLNVNLMSTVDRSELYFSPEKFHSYEGFAMINSLESKKALRYRLLVAFGYQSIEKGEVQVMNRFEAELSYRFKKGIHVKANYHFSNTAQATALGRYSLNQLGLSIIYVFSGRSIHNGQSFN